MKSLFYWQFNCDSFWFYDGNKSLRLQQANLTIIRYSIGLRVGSVAYKRFIIRTDLIN